MDVGRVEQFSNYGSGYDEYEAEYEVDAVGSSMHATIAMDGDILPKSARQREREKEKDISRRARAKDILRRRPRAWQE